MECVVGFTIGLISVQESWNGHEQCRSKTGGHSVSSDSTAGEIVWYEWMDK